MSKRGEYKKTIKNVCKWCKKQSLGNKKRVYCGNSCRNKAWYRAAYEKRSGVKSLN